jgi:hypothetical protein
VTSVAASVISNARAMRRGSMRRRPATAPAVSSASASRLITVTIESNLPVMMLDGI